MIEPLIAPAKKYWFEDAADGFYFMDTSSGYYSDFDYFVVEDERIEFLVSHRVGKFFYYTRKAEHVPFEKAWDVLITKYPDVAEYFLFNPEKIK